MLNDVFDFHLDQQERPERPLPSGRISLRRPAWLGAVLLMLARSLHGHQPALPLRDGRLSRFGRASWDLVLAACIVLYDVLAETHAAWAPGAWAPAGC